MTIILKNALGFLPLWVFILALLSGCATKEGCEWQEWLAKRNDIERVRTIQKQYESSTYNGKY